MSVKGKSIFRKALRAVLYVAGGLAVFLLLLIVALQIVLGPKVCTRLVREYAPMLLDGKLELSQAGVSLFSHFPAVSAEIDSLKITYSSPGDSTQIDTLASFDRLEVAVNVLSLLHRDLNIKRLELSHPRVFVHFYEGGGSNLDIFKVTTNPQDTSSADSSSFVFNDIILRRLIVEDRGYAECRFDEYGEKITANIDRIRAISDGKGGVDIDAGIGLLADTHAFGRIELPLGMKGFAGVSHDEKDDVWKITLGDFDLDLAALHVDADGEVSISDVIEMHGAVSVPDIDIQSVVDSYLEGLIPELKSLGTDARLSTYLQADGVWDPKNNILPTMDAGLIVPKCSITHDLFPTGLVFALDLQAQSEQDGPLSVKANGVDLSCPGLDLSLAASSDDIMSGDPYFKLETSLKASLATLSDQLSDALGLNMSGGCSLDVKGGFHLSNLAFGNLATANLDAKASLHEVRLSTCNDSLKLYVSEMNAKGGLFKSRFGKSNIKLFGVGTEIDSLYFAQTGGESLASGEIKAFVQSSPDPLKADDGTVYNPLFASLDIEEACLYGVDSSSFRLHKSSNRLSIHPQKGKSQVPVIKIKSETGRAGLRLGPDRVFLSGLRMDARANMNTYLRKEKFEHFKDSLFALHPAWTLDSLHNHFSKKRALQQTPSWLSEKDFEKSDFRVEIGESVKKYYRDWDLSGSIGLDRLGIRSPAFPLKMNVTKFDGSFSNDFVSIDTLKLGIGSSKLEADGKVSNLRRFLLGKHGVLKLDADVNVDTLSLAELLSASEKGEEFLSKNAAALSRADDEAYEAMLDKSCEDLPDTIRSAFIIPGNVDADLKVSGQKISIYGLEVYNGSSQLKMKERCLQMTHSAAVSNVGDVSVDAFYSTRAKDDIKAGFSLNLNDIEVDQVIELLPSVDTLMPLLKSFSGLVDCTVAATAGIDESMNLKMSSADGVIRISGEDLHFSDNKQVEKLARLLLFKNPKRATIDSLKIEAMLHDSRLEVFPFLLDIDRWKLAVSGIHNVDNTYRYNVSLVKTPLLFKFGADIYGNDFDDVKFKLGKAKFRKAELPSFTEVVDSTRVNLVESIQNVFKRGVDRIMLENRKKMDITQEREKLGYSRSAALDTLETLSPAMQKQLDSLKNL